MSIFRSLYNWLARLLANLLGGSSGAVNTTTYVQPTSPAKPPVQAQPSRKRREEQPEQAAGDSPPRQPAPAPQSAVDEQTLDDFIPAPKPPPAPAPLTRPPASPIPAQPTSAPTAQPAVDEPKLPSWMTKPRPPAPASPAAPSPAMPEPQAHFGYETQPDISTGSVNKPSAEKPARETASESVPQPLWSESDDAPKSAEEAELTLRGDEPAESEAEPPTRGEPEAAPAPAATPIRFSTYYPKEIKREDWQPVHAYVFKETAGEAVQADAQAQLGAAINAFRAVGVRAMSAIESGALITAAPELPGFEFNPPTASIRFRKDWHRFDFEAQALPEAALNQAANGRITFSVEGVIVGELPLAIFVAEQVAATPIVSKVEGDSYRAVFCSYSHKDTQIAERVETVVKLMGDDYLRDVMSLRSGEDWRDGLKSLIDRADVFQLFWSHAAAASDHVRSEWEYALTQAAQKPKFIRPVYWEKDPNPPFPPELKALHFAFEPKLADWKTV